ncbi:MAG: PilZ domain-containing protein [Planctomycetes bacterium]|nr:PilZ domain-containing protein [Planctomycetota bacterium]
MTSTFMGEFEVASPGAQALLDRRHELREAMRGVLYLIDNRDARVFQARCLDASQEGLRLRIIGDGSVAVGRRYELCSYLPGHTVSPDAGLVMSRRVLVVRAESADEGQEVGVVNDRPHNLNPPCLLSNDDA